MGKTQPYILDGASVWRGYEEFHPENSRILFGDHQVTYRFISPAILTISSCVWEDFLL